MTTPNQRPRELRPTLAGWKIRDLDVWIIEEKRGDHWVALTQGYFWSEIEAMVVAKAYSTSLAAKHYRQGVR